MSPGMHCLRSSFLEEESKIENFFFFSCGLLGCGAGELYNKRSGDKV